MTEPEPVPLATVAMLSAFMRPQDEAGAETLRMTYCLRCRETAALDAPLRVKACDGARCGLRDESARHRERRWIREVLTSGLVDNPQPDRALAARFNDHIARAGCATAGLTDYPDGTIGRGFYAPTLRGQLHALLVAVIAELAGDMLHANVSAQTVPDLRNLASASRATWNDRQAERVRLLAAANLSQLEIKRRTGYDIKTIRKYIKGGKG